MTKVPGLIGRDVRPAAQLLNSYRLVLGNVNKVNSNQAQPGVIIRQYPAAGATVPAGTPVSVWVAQEQPPTVPNLVGNDVRNAPQILGSQLVLGNVRQEETDQAAPGTVLAQNPPAGTRVAAGSGVSVVVAKSQPVEVPDLRGRTAAEAILMLGNKRLNLGTTSQEYTDGKEKAGAVLRQEAVAGTRVPPGTRVNVTVARERQVTVPNVVGQKQANAEGLLDKAGLGLGSVGQRNSPAESGTVLRQDPGAGTQVRAGTAVNVVISQPIGQLLLKVDDAKPVVGQAVRFQAQMTTVAPGAEYQFIFGDGTPGKWTTAAAANHIYQAAGNYRVGVVARVGGQQLSSEPLEVRAQGVRVRLTVESGDAGRDNPVRFTAVLEPTSSQAEYRFVFGDHEETGWTRAAAAEHAYKQSGTYRAHVIARVGRGPFVESNAATVKIGWGVVPMLILGGGGTLLVGGAGIYWYLKRLLRLVRIGVRADATGSQQIEAPALGQWFADVRVRVVRSLGDQTIEWEAPLARGKGVGHE
jgi:beta-lactam-binding protein with PASTA domain